MTLLNCAGNVKLGTRQVARVYAGAQQVWPDGSCLASDLDGLWFADDVNGKTIPNVGAVGSALDAVAENDIAFVEGPCLWLPGSATTGNDAARWANTSLYTATGSETEAITYATAEFAPVQPAPVRGRLITGGFILEYTPGEGVRASMRHSGDTWTYTPFAPLPAEGLVEYRVRWTAAGDFIALQWWNAGAGTWQTIAASGALGGVTLDPGYAYQLSTGQGQLYGRGRLAKALLYVDGARIGGFDENDITATQIGGAVGDLNYVASVADNVEGFQVAAGRALAVNPDDTDSDNRVTTGEGIVAEAVAEPVGSSSGLRIAGTGAVAQLYPGGTDLAFIIDHGSAGCPVTPAISMDTFRAFNGNGGGILRYTSDGTLQFITGNGVALSAFSVVGFGSSAAVGKRFTGFEYDESAGQVEAFWSDDGVSWTSVGTGSATPIASVTGTAANFDLLYVGTETWRAPVADLRLIHGSLSDTPVLRLTAGDMARGAEGDTSFPASTGQTVTVLGDVTFRPTLFSGVEPSVTGGSFQFDGFADETLGGNDMAFYWDGVVALDSDGGDDPYLMGCNGFGANGGFYVRLTALDTPPARIRFGWSDGTTTNFDNSNTINNLELGDRLRFWVTFQEDDGTGATVVRYWSSLNGGNWVTEGSDTIPSPGFPMGDNSNDLAINAFNPGGGDARNVGTVYEVGVALSIDDPTVRPTSTAILDYALRPPDLARLSSAQLAPLDVYTTQGGHEFYERLTPGDASFTGDAPLVIPADEDGLLMWAGVAGNPTGAFPNIVRVGHTSDQRLTIYRRDSGAAHSWSIEDDAGDAVGGWQLSLGGDLTAGQVLALWVDRSNDLLHGYIIDADGTTVTGTRPLNGAGSITISEGLAVLMSVPGAMSAAVFDRGEAKWSTARIEALASWLFDRNDREPTEFVGEFPPGGPYVPGDRYRCSDGSLAEFDGKRWVALSGTTAATLADMTGLWVVE